jgi:hypothetical protein
MKRFLNNLEDYPIVHSQRKVLPLLNDGFTRAIILQTPDFSFNPKKIKDDPNFEDCDKYWKDDSHRDGRRQPGEVPYTLKEHLSDLTQEENILELLPEHVEQETKQAGILVSKNDITELHQKIIHAMEVFSNIVEKHTNNKNFYMRCWQMWGPVGGQGRSPTLHIDNTAITALWYAARTPADIYTGKIPERVWPALDPANKYKKKFNGRAEEFTKTISPKDLTPLPLNALIVTRNAKEATKEGEIVARPLDRKHVRRTVCPHKSGDLRKHGQAGIVLVPRFF